MSATSFCDACGAALADSIEICPNCGKVQQTPAAQPSIQPKALPVGFLLKKRYRIIKQIGAGGFGLVYQAEDTHLFATRLRATSLVAIKQITLATLSAQQMIEVTASYNREIMLLPSLQHSNIPSLYDHFTDPEHWYIVLEYVAGQTLEEILASAPEGHLSVERTLRIGMELCTVLDYLHTQTPPIIFRDVKPANVMFTRHGKVYLIDFGIARRYRDGQRRDTVPLGSPGYAAPEQYGKAQTTRQTDIYGLGATLQTLLTGKEPWEIRSPGMLPDLSIPIELRIELQKLLAKMLEPDLDHRPVRIITVRESLKNIHDTYYPSFAPTAWLMGSWTLFWLILSLILAQPSFNITQWFTLYIGIRASFYFYRAWFDIHKRLNKHDVKLLFAGVLNKTGAGCLGGLALLLSFVLGSLFTTLSIPQLLILVLGFLCWFPALFMISRDWWPRLRRAKNAAQSRQAAPLPPMIQRLRRRF